MTGELRRARADIAKLGRTRLEAVLADSLLEPADIEIVRRRLMGHESYVYISTHMGGYSPEAIGKRYRAAIRVLEAIAEQNGYISGTFPGKSGE